MRVSSRDRGAAHEVPLGHLHRNVAADLSLGLAILRGLRDWEQGRVCSEVWVGARRYKAREWATLGQMGYTGAEDELIWARMVRDDWEGEEAVKEEPPPTKGKPAAPKPAVTKTRDTKSYTWHFESDDSSDGATPHHHQETPPPSPPPPPPPATKATPTPKTTAPPQRGGGGTDDPHVGTKVHVPYPTGMEVGTVTGVHRRKAGLVWVEYPNNSKLYEEARGLLFPTPKRAQEHVQPPPPEPSG